MQQDISPLSSIRCPLCAAPVQQELREPRRKTSSTGEEVLTVFCSSCGYHGSFVPRQQQTEPGAALPFSPSRSSVWIDPVGSVSQRRNLTEHPAYHQKEAARRTKKLSNPATPIPLRASAQHRAIRTRVRPKYPPHVQQEGDLTRLPTLPPPSLWEYESPDYQVESSVSSLSLVVDPPVPSAPIAHPIQPTHPEPALKGKPTKPLSDIDEIDTVPFVEVCEDLPEIDELNTVPSFGRGSVPLFPPINANALPDIDKVKTIPEHRADAEHSVKTLQALIPLPFPAHVTDNMPADAITQPDLPMREPSSWRPGLRGMRSNMSHTSMPGYDPMRQRHTFELHPLERVRWWLLHPGRLEAVLWVCGSLLLLIVTLALAVATAASFIVGTNSSSGNFTNRPTSTTLSGLTVTLLNGGAIVPGEPISLYGQGFRAHGHVECTYDNKHPLLLRQSSANIVQADGSGVWKATFASPAWDAGVHRITVRELGTGRATSLSVMVTVQGSTATPSSTPQTAGFTPTPTSSSVSGSNGPPIGQTTTPTPVSPTPTPGKPTPTTTPVTPTPTSTTTPVPTVTATITPSPTSGASSFTSSKETSNAPSSFSGNVSIGERELSSRLGISMLSAPGPWTFLLIAGYMLAMLLLGIAGVLRKRQGMKGKG